MVLLLLILLLSLFFDILIIGCDNMKKKKKESVDKSKRNLVVCPHCGFENTKHLKSCLSCGKELVGAKSCPRCAKINVSTVKKCVNCGYRFTKSKVSTIASLIFCGLLLVVLMLLMIFGQTEIVKSFLDNFRWVAVIIIILIVISTLTYGRKEKIDYDSYNDAIKNDLMYKKIFSKIAIIVGLLIAAGIIYFTFF